jgi:hypothetical protein
MDKRRRLNRNGVLVIAKNNLPAIIVCLVIAVLLLSQVSSSESLHAQLNSLLRSNSSAEARGTAGSGPSQVLIGPSTDVAELEKEVEKLVREQAAHAESTRKEIGEAEKLVDRTLAQLQKDISKLRKQNTRVKSMLRTNGNKPDSALDSQIATLKVQLNVVSHPSLTHTLLVIAFSNSMTHSPVSALPCSQ